MKLVTYRSARGSRAAALVAAGTVDLNDADSSIPACTKQLLAAGPDMFRRAAEAASRAEPLPTADLTFLPPVPNPEKIICVGLNYADHAREGGFDLPAEPVIFGKFPSAVLADGQPIVLPAASQKVDYEAELVVVIGRGGRHIARPDALGHVAAYCCGNDVSSRDWQLGKPGGQWLLGKTFDTFAPFGPYLVTADEAPNPNSLRIRSRVNGQTMQDSNTSQLIFPVDELIAYVSGVCTLSPGDLLFTGTPPGVGFARTPPVFLQAGDVVEVEIDGLGILRNPVA
ncbi:MAG: fumarylacetoacetate hydrolase family protein [Patescibacteria group bacterium]|nr:fumarylacetoacetate hydrolase family protein [Patescibacteria group bacterium]